MNATRSSVEARWVSGDLLALARTGSPAGSVTARFGPTLHAELGGFVVAVLPPGAPRLPNGLSIATGLGGEGAPEVGDPVVLTRRGLAAGPLSIAWDAERPPRWDGRVARWGREHRRGLRERACAILGTAPDGGSPEVAAEPLARIDGFAGDPGARAGLESLVAAVRSGDPRDAARAGRELAGRGPGLTPLGDDVLAATALTVASAGAASAWSAGTGWRAWLAELAPPDLRRRTTSLSATMLELAVRGRGIGPARELLRPGPLHDRRLRRELAGLRGLGHTTGAAYAATIGAVALLLAPGENRTNQKETI